MSLRSSFSVADVVQLDELITEHHRLFLKVLLTARLCSPLARARARRLAARAIASRC